MLISALTGCGPTYPKESIKESIIRVCKKEYNLDVKVEMIGKTIAIYLPLPDLMDMNFAISKKATEEINDVILSVSRVSLSTDASFDFYCLIAHDTRIPEVQIVIIKSVDDVKRFLLNDISRGEYSKRMLVDIRMSPQAQKERSIKEIMSRMTMDKSVQNQIMNDFFRSEPTGLGDIGYWSERFYIKDISMAEFLAEQIANRIRIDFKEDKGLSETFALRSSRGYYISKMINKFFRLEVLAEPKLIGEIDEKSYSDKVFGEALAVAAQVLHGYRFSDFDYVEITDEASRKSIKVDEDILEDFRKKKASLEDILAKTETA